MLAEVGLPSGIRLHQGASACIPRCWMLASSPWRRTPAPDDVGNGGLLLPLGVRRLRAMARPAMLGTATHG